MVQLPADVAQTPNRDLDIDTETPILEDSDEEDEIVSALSASTITPVSDPLNRFIP